MRACRICGRSLDLGPGGADRLLDFLFSRCQRIVRDVQRALLDFSFDYAVQCFDRIRYLLLVSGSPSFFSSIRAAIVSLKLEFVGSVLFFMPLNRFVQGVMISCIRYPLSPSNLSLRKAGTQEV